MVLKSRFYVLKMSIFNSVHWYMYMLGALVVTHAMLRRLTSRCCIIIIIIMFILKC